MLNGTHFTIRTDDSNPDGVRIHRLKGVFTNSSMAYEFLEELRADLKASDDAVILDLSDLEHMTSGGVGMLAALYTSARDAERSLMLAASRSRVTAVMQVSGLLPIIPAYDSVEDALRALMDGDVDSTEMATGTA